MFKKWPLILLIISILALTSCIASDRIREDFHVTDIWGDDAEFNTLIVNDETTFNDQIILSGDGKVWQQKTMPIQIARIIAAGKPTRVEQDIFQGFSLPVGGADEELFSCQCVPGDWDGTDMYLYAGGWLDTANTGKNFQLRMSYDHWTAGDVVPNSPTEADVETATGIAAQYTTFKIQFPIAATDIEVGDALGIKLVRIAASVDEIVGEFVVEGMVLVYRVDKLGSATP